ncbi:UNVERIFIED_CONTAM: hypothetical protein PYX00_004974 [Menopon gallinae]
MNSFEEEPRKVPQPVPFSQNSPLQPAVPEVSLILQDTSRSLNPDPNNSFSGTEFQTYNAWRWKTINEKEKENLTLKCKNERFYSINDKFSCSDIERRKNEILYGSSDEPRRPLPPRPIPVIPECIGASFSDISVNDPWQVDDIGSSGKLAGKSSMLMNNDSFKISKPVLKKSDRMCDNLNDIRDLYQIIAEQNKQMVFLQKQIDQLLKSQDTKEKQIEQLLKSHGTKECKIEQLLKMQDMKERHIEQLLKAQEKLEKQVEQLIKSQEIREEHNKELLKQLQEKKDVATVGVMTTLDLFEKGINTSFVCTCKDQLNEDICGKNSADGSADCARFGTGDKSFTLHSLDLPVIEEHTPTPQSSIHVDIPEYNASSDEESDSSSTAGKEIHIHYSCDSKPLGYTFYNTVLTQVNDIIQSQEDKENGISPQSKSHEKFGDFENRNLRKYTCLKEHNAQILNPIFGPETVENGWCFNKETCMEVQQYKKKPSSSLKGMRDSSFHCDSSYNLQKETQSPSDISLKMNALALKYLKEEQISQYQVHSQPQENGKQPDVTIYNVTNLSFGTMRY